MPEGVHARALISLHRPRGRLRSSWASVMALQDRVAGSGVDPSESEAIRAAALMEMAMKKR